uniref:Large ribosomal subunit protein bL19c n=1 Tax=Streptosarcina moshanensis TaxID=3096259 RepID=A0AAU0UEZ4_9VIRI|nr:ribosomal protein L19 [Streptosarcina arenaria]WKT08869.1 ribosomal protein L19 [Streptosarcina arenaria]
MSYAELVSKIEATQSKTDLPSIHPGDLLRVGVVIREGNKSRVQPFEGTVIATHHRGAGTTVVLRRLSQGVSVERVLLVHSIKIASLKVLRRSKVRRAKLYYLRKPEARRTKLKQRL